MTSELIKEILTTAFQPSVLELVDQSAAHAGHIGSRQHGGGHYQLTIVASAFEGQSLVKRHQMVYQALGDLMKQQIHALSIQAFSPFEHN
jgi:BolA protein